MNETARFFFTKYEVYPEEGSTENENKNTFVGFKKSVNYLFTFSVAPSTIYKIIINKRAFLSNSKKPFHFLYLNQIKFVEINENDQK